MSSIESQWVKADKGRRLYTWYMNEFRDRCCQSRQGQAVVYMIQCLLYERIQGMMLILCSLDYRSGASCFTCNLILLFLSYKPLMQYIYIGHETRMQQQICHLSSVLYCACMHVYSDGYYITSGTPRWEQKKEKVYYNHDGKGIVIMFQLRI